MGQRIALHLLHGEDAGSSRIAEDTERFSERNQCALGFLGVHLQRFKQPDADPARWQRVKYGALAFQVPVLVARHNGRRRIPLVISCQTIGSKRSFRTEGLALSLPAATRS